MTDITVKYKGLTGAQGEITIDNGETLDDLIADIATEEGISNTDYYRISLSRNYAINDVVEGDSSNTLLSLGVVTGDEFLCATKQYGTKEERQKQKLDIAAAKRSDTYDITQLPTQYSGNDVVDNPNSGGLLETRPWADVASPVLTDNLVVHLDAGNTDSYPGSGTTWTDLVDDTEYTIANGSFDSDDSGSIVFNGTSTLVPIGTPLSNGTNLTKEAWVWDDGAGDGSRNILSSADNVLFLSGSTLNAGVGGGYTLVSESSFPTGAWRHVVQTFDDSTNTMRLYINGVEVDENTSVSQSYTSQTERIGAHFFGGNPVSFWNGKIAQVRVYSEALTESQVVANYDATKATYGF